MSKTIFIKEPNRKGEYEVFEGTPKPGNVFAIERFVCTIGRQETEEKTKELAEFVLGKLNS